MTLTLELSPASVTKAGDATRHVFGEDGGSIGRAASSSWVLTHNKVSGQHALVTFRNGVFYIQDTSRNGIAVNSPDNRLMRNRPYALKAGDRLFIEPYEIEVWVDTAAEQSSRQPAIIDPFAADEPFGVGREPSRPLSGLGPLDEPQASDDVDPLNFFDPVGGRARRAEPPPPRADDLLGAHYEPPAVVPEVQPLARPEPVPIPQGYDPLAPEEPVVEAPPPVRPRPGDAAPAARKAKDVATGDATVRQPAPGGVRSEPQPAVGPAPAVPRSADAKPREAGGAADLSELLAGAGVPDAVITAELSRNLGRILRIVVSGLMDILQSRQRIKEEFRMHQTLFRPVDNNPLKFSANVEDALHNLLVKRNPAYLAAADAFADAFDDLRDHQLAMLAGMRVAFEAMLAEFDADKLQGEFDRQLAKLSLPLVPAKLRYWDLYREKRQEMAKDPEATFARLFGEEFRRAYEEQFRELRAQRRGRPRAAGPGGGEMPDRSSPGE